MDKSIKTLNQNKASTISTRILLYLLPWWVD